MVEGAPDLDLSRFRKRSNALGFWHLTGRSVIYAGLIAGTVSAFNNRLWIQHLMLLAVTGIFSSFWGWAGVGHEFYHGTVFSSRKLNRLLYRACAVMTWANPGYFAATHRRHHANTLKLGDPENQSRRWINGLEWLPLLTIDVRGMVRRVGILARNVVGFVPRLGAEELSLVEKREIRNGAILVVVCQTMWMLICFLAFRSPALWLSTSLTPWLMRAPNVLLERLQHYGCAENSDDVFSSTRTVMLPRWLAVLYANMNYHTEHHAAPYVPFYQLPLAYEHIVPERIRRAVPAPKLAEALLEVRAISLRLRNR